MAYEDYTTFTELDPTSDITVESATKISFEDLTQSGGYRVFKDYTADHFDGDFTHQFEVQFSDNVSSCSVYPWTVANVLNTGSGIIGTPGEYAACFLIAGSLDFYLRLIEDGSIPQDSWPDAVESTTYYITIDRDDDGGVNSAGRYTMYIRTGSHEGALQDTLVVDAEVGGQKDYRYLYALEDHGAGGGSIDGFVQNLDINEVTDNISKVMGIPLASIAKIGGIAIADINKVMGITKQL
jgi:hypothetical protein